MSYIVKNDSPATDKVITHYGELTKQFKFKKPRRQQERLSEY